jgi:hypothetical protein
VEMSCKKISNTGKTFGKSSLLPVIAIIPLSGTHAMLKK